jgi:hypothetical protein
MTTRLDDPDTFPDDNVLAELLGKRSGLWDLFSRTMVAGHAGRSADWTYYRDGKRWLCKVNAKKKTLCWVSVWPGMFKVTCYFGSRYEAEVAKAGIPPALKRAFRASAGKSFRPITVEVTTKAALKDVEALLELKERLR